MKCSQIGEYDRSFDPHFSHLPEDFSFRTLSSLDFIKPDSITFLKNKKLLSVFLQSEREKKIERAYLLVEKKFFTELKSSPEYDILSKTFSGMGTVDSIDLSMALLSLPFYRKKYGKTNDMVDGRQMGSATIHPSADIAQQVFIGEGVEVEENVTIHPGSVVMAGCRIGKETVIHPNVSVYYDVKIGPFCRIHSNTVIGSDGFGYRFHEGTQIKIWHLGGVVIEDHVEIGANCSIDRGTFRDTIIGQGSKLDNAVHIGHNCVVGKGVIFCGQSALSGSVRVGDGVIFGGRSGVGHGAHIGAGCSLAGGTVTMKSWPEGQRLGGYPAMSLNEWLRSSVAIKKLITKEEKRD
ncbi:MAG: UDP-3-O-(3-hydroxymyristoyl)glucosamine N-acyltransferase [Bacteriovoracales bacterium]|nr:UDP-3-O-(3-hydroxymyristoyl)glucosamine N-acyltransferase [Bacteriovoracales bacterium]